MSCWSGARLEQALTGLGDVIDVGDENLDVMALVEGEPMSRRGLLLRPLARAAVIVLVLALGLLLAVAPTREAIADWLGIGRTRIELPTSGDTQGETAAGLDRIETGAISIDESAASSVLGRGLPSIPDLEPLDIRVPPEGGVVLVYPDGLTLWVQVEASGSPPLRKQPTADGFVRWVDELGDGGLVIGGLHTLITPGRRLQAATVILWTSSGLELRLEGDLPEALLLELAFATSV